MSFDLKVINQFRALNASILKLQCKFTPDVTIIPAAFSNPQLKIAIVAPLYFINTMRSIIEKFKCIYPCFAFYTQDGTCVRHVNEGEIIGKGNVNGFDEQNFGKIIIPDGFDKVIIILNNHRSKLSVLKNKINNDLEIDCNKLKDNIICAIEKGTTSIDLFIDNPLFDHLKRYEWCEKLTTILSINDNICFNFLSNNVIENYSIKFICETYFGLLESVSNKGINIELNIENVVFYTTEANPLHVQIAYNETRKTFSLKIESNECIDFDVILFLTQDITSINPKSGLKENINVIESKDDVYPYLDSNEFCRLINFFQNINIESIARFNPYLYKFSPIPLFKELNDVLPSIEFRHLLEYMWKQINDEEFKNSKNTYQNIFGISKKTKFTQFGLLNHHYDDFIEPMRQTSCCVDNFV
jgi:hypothetical protein